MGVVGSTPVTRQELEAAVARLGLSPCDALHVLVDSELLRQACLGDATCVGDSTSGSGVTPETIRAIRDGIVAGSPYLSSRRGARDPFLRGYATDRAIRADIDRRIARLGVRTVIRLGGCREE